VWELSSSTRMCRKLKIGPETDRSPAGTGQAVKTVPAAAFTEVISGATDRNCDFATSRLSRMIKRWSAFVVS
jgi:hypothetical protein